MKRTKDMTSATLAKTYKPFELEEPAPGECLRDCREMWSKLTIEDKRHLATLIGADMVLRIEMRHLFDTI